MYHTFAPECVSLCKMKLTNVNLDWLGSNHLICDELLHLYKWSTLSSSNSLCILVTHKLNETFVKISCFILMALTKEILNMKKERNSLIKTNKTSHSINFCCIKRGQAQSVCKLCSFAKTSYKAVQHFIRSSTKWLIIWLTVFLMLQCTVYTLGCCVSKSTSFETWPTFVPNVIWMFNIKPTVL